MNRQQELGSEPISKLLLKYSIPAIIGMIVNALYNVVDRMFIGNIPDIGALAITGVGITMPIVTILLAFAMLIGLGATASISIKLGQGNKEEAERILGNATTLSIIVGIILMVLGLLFASDLLLLFGGSENTLQYGREYILLFLVGTIFNIMAFVFTSIMRADGNPKISALTMIIGCVLNIILDAVFIFILDKGIGGAALATIISQAVSAIIGFYYFTKGPSHLKIKSGYLKLNLKRVQGIFAIGAAPFAMQICISLVQVITNNALKATGEEIAIGAMTTITSIIMLVLMPIFGINQGAQPIIGYNYGAKHFERSQKTLLLAMGSATIILIVGFIGIQAMPTVLVRMFDSEGAIEALAVPGIRIYSLSLPIVAIPIMGANYFQAIGKAKIAMLLSLLRQVLVLIPIIIILSKIGGLTGIWAAQPTSDVITTLLIGILIVREFKNDKERLS
ncbi:MATE family efflux transporter [Sporanaerobium hydrogeniformans]|uniref:MATE family efflux transporter n=1 Tax=Sporanaerobium hydrogeniformans TaxID=3072179 RepID=A0AC61DGF6_9FIRM|nr:MATE family efflux transporter [Sporanaerobium hydrogeniformans]PHV71935.1 MATE family efflux transporter [Sporanaerobium hydrogeniformans]